MTTVWGTSFPGLGKTALVRGQPPYGPPAAAGGRVQV